MKGSTAKDVAQSPTRRRWVYRTALIAGTGVFTLATLWSAGVFPVSWFAWLQRSSPAKSAQHVPTLSDWAKQVKAKVPSGPVGIAPPAPTGNDSSISKVPLPLILTATRPGRNVHEGYADIGIDAKSPQTYVAGAILANGARIAEIYADSVVLQKSGQSVRLYIQGQSRGREPDVKLVAALLSVGGTPPPPPAIADSQETLTDFIRPSPVYDGAVLRGYQVYAGANTGVFSQLGLQPGDVIQAIDGSPLSDPQSAISQLETLTQGAAITATIERKGESVTVSLDGAVIAAAMERAKSATAIANAAPIPSM